MTNEELIRTACHVIWTEGDIDRMGEFYAEDFECHASPAGTSWGKGLADAQALARSLREGFPDYNETIEDLLVDGDKVVVRLTVRGTHTGPMAGLEPTGKEVAITDISILRVEDGKIAEQWAMTDNLTLMAQLGIIEAPAA